MKWIVAMSLLIFGGRQALSDDSGWPILAGLVLARVGMFFSA
jgi:hypothetical protein